MKKLDFDLTKLRDSEDDLHFPTTKSLVLFKVLPTLTWSLFTGAVCGFFVSIFCILIDLISEYSSEIFVYFSTHPSYVALFLLGAGVLGGVMWLLLKWLPEARGSGVPRAESMARGKESHKSYRVLLGTFVGTAISSIAGLSVGIEGPSVGLGAGIGSGVSDLAHSKGKSRDYTITAGTAAGFSIAFGAPLAGVVFALEDVRRTFNPLAVASTCIAVFGAAAVKGSIYGALGLNSAFLSVSTPLNLPAEHFLMFVVLGIAVGLFAELFYRVILSIQRSAKKSAMYSWVPVVFVFVLTAMVGLLVSSDGGSSYASGSGTTLIKSLLLGYGEMDWQLNIFVFFIKFALIILCFRSKATGGMMVPMLTLGALIGGVCGDLFVNIGYPTDYFAVVVIVGMVSFFGATIFAPITAVVICVEMFGFDFFVPLLIAVCVSTLVRRIGRSAPLYDEMADIDREAKQKPRFLTFVPPLRR